MRPLRDQVLVTPTASPAMTDGGLHIPDVARERPIEGEVIAVGPDARAVAVGDTVAFRPYAGVKFSVADEEQRLMREEEILGVFETGD